MALKEPEKNVLDALKRIDVEDAHILKVRRSNIAKLY